MTFKACGEAGIGWDLRTLVGIGIACGFQGRLALVVALMVALTTPVLGGCCGATARAIACKPRFTPHRYFPLLPVRMPVGTLLATGC